MASASPRDRQVNRIRGWRKELRSQSSDDEQEGEKPARQLREEDSLSRSQPDLEHTDPACDEVAQLRAELANATAAIRAQSQDWAAFISDAKREIAGLHGSAKQEWEVNSHKLREHQTEPDTQFDSSHRNIGGSNTRNPSLGYSRRMADDLASVSGGLSAAKVTEIMERLLFNFQQSLISKAGFIGGLFHTWRCEVILAHGSRKFDYYMGVWQDRRQKQFALVMHQWERGDEEGLLVGILHAWRTFSQGRSGHRGVRARIQLALLKFLEGSRSGLIDTIFHQWHNIAFRAKSVRVEERHLNTVQELNQAVARLTYEHSMLAEQLQMVYQQLDSVTETLQKELKTKEELAKDLRQANDQMRHSFLSGSLPATPRGKLNLTSPLDDLSCNTSISEASHRSYSSRRVGADHGVPPMPAGNSIRGKSSRPWSTQNTPRGCNE